MRIREEFCRGYYGKVAPEVLEFLLLMDKVAEEPVHVFAVWDPPGIVSAGFARDVLRILERAGSVSDDPSVRNRIGKLMLSFWYTMLLNPAMYGLSDQEAPAVWKQAKQVIADNKITFIRESGAPDGDAPGWVLEMDARFASAPKGMVFDLMRIERAKTENCADWRTSSVSRSGHLLRTVFQHPDGRSNGDATYEVPLPALSKNGRLVMKFAAVISNRTQDGVRFSVLVDGNEQWSETKTAFLPPDRSETQAAHENILPGRDPFSDHTLDLSKYAGQTIRLTLRVNALADNSNDWANWVAPRIVEEP